MDISDTHPVMGKSETGWILAVITLLAVIIIGCIAWAATVDDSDPMPTPVEESVTTPQADSADLDGGMDMTLPAPEEGEYKGIGEPPA